MSFSLPVRDTVFLLKRLHNHLMMNSLILSQNCFLKKNGVLWKVPVWSFFLVEFKGDVNNLDERSFGIWVYGANYLKKYFIASKKLHSFTAFIKYKLGSPESPGAGGSLRHFTTLFAYDFDLGLGSQRPKYGNKCLAKFYCKNNGRNEIFEKKMHGKEVLHGRAKPLLG